MLTNKALLTDKKTFTKMVSLPNISLAAEEADRFIDYIVDTSVLKNSARIVRMNKETKNIRALGLGDSRFLYPGSTFSASNYLTELSDNNITLTSKKLRGAVRIHDDDLEDNIEGNAFADHIMRMVAGQIANELEEIFWIGDTQSVGGFAATDARSLFDGWRYQITNAASGEDYENDVSGSPTVLDGTSDFTNAGGIAARGSSAPYDWEFKYSLMLKSLDPKYKKGGLANLRFYQSDRVSQDYVDALAARATILGDNAIINGEQMKFGRVPIVDVPTMPTAMTAGGVYTGGAYADCLLTPKDNLIIGIQRDVKIEASREAADESTYFFYTMRMDNAIENVNACVLTEKLTTA